MFNLILPEYQKKLRTEYNLRLVIVICGAISVLLVISLTFLLPSYIFSRIELGASENRVDSARNSFKAAFPNDDVALNLVTAKNKAQLLRSGGREYSVYGLFHELESKPAEINIKEVSYTNDGDVLRVYVKGTAEKRDSLKRFGEALQKNKNFESVDLPISNFTKDSNIDFSLTIILKK